ncbi:hypothetical protein COEREDRAFT_89932 [Coemansia reversa NRRL 1564]|uniref:WD40 repeat-like protein n=1 Tax=Coemansia reversa (strain ATCC 12441 / NRRL 1564) TaxID=763665 RepID=A0A2G5B1T2_COERN|nr:hypothetical protein COEREDRAFT_89932 [Coemansia reversa NRRL 1564]|eukprot:PIA12964.1 hypothetical protein COEREDRAFT_89932 [Coemansia reversa NRRL 1564]
MPTTRSQRTVGNANSQQQTGDNGDHNATIEQPVRRHSQPTGSKRKSSKTIGTNASITTYITNTGKLKRGSYRNTKPKAEKEKPVVSDTPVSHVSEAMAKHTSEITASDISMDASRSFKAVATHVSEATVPKKRGRPLGRKSAQKQKAPDNPKYVDSQVSNTAAQSISNYIELHTPESVVPRKRGRPRKNAAQQPVVSHTDVTEQPKSVDFHTPEPVVEPVVTHKHSSPSKDTVQQPVVSHTDATEQPKSVDIHTPEPVVTRKHGRSRKDTVQQPVVSHTDATEQPKSVDIHTPEPVVTRKHGRSRKDVTQQPKTPRKRGRKSKADIEAAAKRNAKNRKDLDSEYEDMGELPTHEDDMKLDADDFALFAGSPLRKKGRLSINAANTQRKQMEALWMGPTSRGMAENINPNYIDVGLEYSTWSWLRNVHVDAGAVTIEPYSGPIGMPQNDTETTNTTVTATMGGADHSQQMELLDVHRLTGPTPGWAVNTGEHIAALDWAPAALPGNNIDYLASAGMGPTPAGGLGTVLTRRERTAHPGSICLWRIATAASSPACRLDMQLSHNYGYCLALRWCPVGINSDNTTEGAAVVGILAAAFGDGGLRILPVPEPDSLRQYQATILSTSDSDNHYRLFADPVRMQWPEVSLAELCPLKGVVTALAWATSDILVAGTSRGVLMAWDLGGVVRAQQQKHQGRLWPYTQLSDPSATPKKPNPAPIICQQLHNGPIFSVSTYIAGTSFPVMPFAHGRDSYGFRRVSPIDIQVVTLGADGRFRQTFLALPTRLSVPLVNIPRSTTVGCAYWPLGTCVFAEKTLRLLNNVLEKPGDPWISQENPVTSTETRNWNQPDNHKAHHIMILDCPLMYAGISDLHGYLALARSDGCLILTNLLPASNRNNILKTRVIYRVICKKDTGELMWLPREPVLPISRGFMKSSNVWFNLFPPEITIITAAWSRNPKSSHWIASTSASGILRIEDVSR